MGSESVEQIVIWRVVCGCLTVRWIHQSSNGIRPFPQLAALKKIILPGVLAAARDICSLKKLATVRYVLRAEVGGSVSLVASETTV